MVAFLLGAIARHRGLVPTPFGLNTVCFLGHAVGAMSSLVALSIAVSGFFGALR